MDNIAALRKEYSLQSLSEKDADPNPFVQFEKWWMQAMASSIDDVNAMTLATANKQGVPSARIVLLKGYDTNGFVFFTNYMSHKASDLDENPLAALVFYWKELERQVRIQGTVAKIKNNESDKYFASRPHGSQIGAWASPQSTVISNRDILETKVIELQKQYAHKNILRPPFWGGYIVIPSSFEFWQGRSNRLHDRLLYEQENNNPIAPDSYRAGWKISRLAP